MAVLDDCGCCGTDPPAPPPVPRPGLAALAHRSGTQATVLHRMLDRLATRLPALTSRATDDPAVALLDAWATVADVVTFYQERILNEGYLRTATERRSVLELARAIGYELRPGVAASTHLVFTVDGAPGAPTSATVPASTPVRSVPGEGERSQTFETGADLSATVELNAVGLRTRAPQVVGPGRTHLHLAGVATGLSAGDAILIVRRPPDAATGSGPPDFRTLRSVTPVPGQPSVTRVEWTPDLPLTPAGSGDTVADVYAFRLRATLFGQSAPDWRTFPNTIRRRYVPAGTTPKAFRTWPNFGLPAAATGIDLDAAYPAVVAGSTVALTQPGLPPTVATVKAAEVTGTENFGISARTTRVTLKAAADLSGFDRRQAVVHARTEKLDLADEPLVGPVSGTTLVLDRTVPLPSPSTVVVTGTTDPGGTPFLETRTVIVTGATLTLDTPVPALVRESVRVLGNVVRATHGETVEDEVLGSGDGTATHQRFTLRKPELTHVPAPTATGAADTLEVRVDGVLWTEVGSLFSAGPQDRAYVVRIDDDAMATVVFGDGVRGARLPTGSENVRARYRSGIGPDGDVAAGSLSLLPRRPLGITTVTNPLRATGGVGPERLDEARANAPVTVLTLDRVVSVRDHEDFASAFTGIARARAVALQVGAAELVHLTVAAAGGGEVGPTTVGALRDAIVGLGGDAATLRIASRPPLRFRVGVELLIDPAYRRSDVDAAVTEALRAAFAADRRSFAQPVTAAEVIATVQPVDGVVAARLAALYVETEPAGVREILLARDARYDPTAPDRIAPAELLVVDPDGITPTEMAP